MSPAPRTVPAGTRYGRLVVTVERRPGEPDVAVRCDCGTATTVALRNLGRITNSCGCLRADRNRETWTTHGLAGTPIYDVWADMVARCTRPTHARWSSYGGRGITVCDRWRDFTVFHADMGDPPAGRSLDRRDNDGPYSPANCRWATPSEQNTNRRPTAYAGSAHDPVTGRFLPRSATA